MKSNPVGWFEIYVDDMKRAKKFYESVFQTELQQLPSTSSLEMVGFPMDRSTMGAGGALCRMPGLKSGGASTIVYFSSLDCVIEEKRVAEAGGKIQKPKISIGEYGFISLAVDTEGNVFGIHSQK